MVVFAAIGLICVVVFLAGIFYLAHRDVTYGWKDGWKDEEEQK